jgi:isopenicillin N synthase-like dioxygenase
MESLADVPVIDVRAFLEKDTEKMAEQCKLVAQSLHQFGILIFKDPRVVEQDNEDYLDMMEEYFEAESRKLYKGEKLVDCKPEHNFQAGVTPEKQERARNHQHILDKMTPENMPQSKFPPEPDCKWRFFWAIGERPAEVAETIPRVIPAAFPDWENRMNKWGNLLMEACFTAGEMAAIGMGLPHETFITRMKGGPHLLAPTGSDLERYDIGTTFAGFHYDLNFMTIHGKCRFPGLSIWLRNNTKVSVKVPTGCLLLQAGAMFEHITGGYVLAGFHEVVYTEGTKAALEKAKQENLEGGKRIPWRVSSTLFSHLRYNVDLSPISEMKGFYDEAEARQKYRKMTAQEKVMEEL